MLFEDILCQMTDMLTPEREGRITLRDLKRCKLAGNFFNVLFNLNKFIAFETRDPFTIRQACSQLSACEKLLPAPTTTLLRAGHRCADPALTFGAARSCHGGLWLRAAIMQKRRLAGSLPTPDCVACAGAGGPHADGVGPVCARRISAPQPGGRPRRRGRLHIRRGRVSLLRS